MAHVCTKCDALIRSMIMIHDLYSYEQYSVKMPGNNYVK